MLGRGHRNVWIVTMVAAGGLVIAAIALAAGGKPQFTAGSASGDIARWRISFSESGLAPGSTVAYSATAKASATYICPNYPRYDALGGGHGAPQHFRVYKSSMSMGLTATADSVGVVHKGGSAPQGFVTPTCSDGSTPALSSYGLYNVRILDATNNVRAPSLRGSTQPPPR